MLTQMILGTMNLAVMMALTAILETEKVWKRSPLLSRGVAVCTVAAGMALLAAARH